MILEYGQTEKLAGSQWYMIELRSEKTIESTMRRVGKAIPTIFRNDPVELFIPVFNRDLDIFDMKTGPYIFVRSSNFQALLRLKTITGVVSLVTEGESNRPSKAIAVEDEYVQGVIKNAEEEFRKRAIGIEVDSFVRILNGDTRDFCGVVEAIGDGKAIVRITLKTKSILLETPIRNLLNLSHVPVEQRVYYFCPLVNELCIEKQDGTALIEEDLKLDVDAPTDIAEEYLKTEPKRHSRQKTVTALVKKLILIDNQIDPLEIAKKVVASLKSEEIKAPKNLFIVYCIIKDNLMRNYFKKIDPNLNNYRDVINKYGATYKFSAKLIAKIDSELKIPVITTEVCKDGRSREARQRSRGEVPQSIDTTLLKLPKRRGRPPKVRPVLEAVIEIPVKKRKTNHKVSARKAKKVKMK